MKIESYLPVFPGFYNTIFEADEEPYIEDGKTWEDYNWFYDEYHERVSRDFSNAIETRLKECFDIEIDFQELVSPREYNFETDAINVEYKLTKVTYQKILKYLRDNDAAFEKYIEERYTSRSGFLSSYSSNHHSWYLDLEMQHELNHKFGAILNFICINEEITADEIHYDIVHEMYVECELKNVNELS